jgi:hypothetical protein
MGREIRRVPANWQHPTYVHELTGQTRLQPMFDRNFDEAAAEWKAELAKWEAGERPSYYDAEDHTAGHEYWEWNGEPPVRAYYRPWSDEAATWFQCWETVSEGTPVSPAFATADELIHYLATKGDFWDQKRGDPAWGLEAATRFVNAGWAPSLIVQNGVVTDGKLANLTA